MNYSAADKLDLDGSSNTIHPIKKGFDKTGEYKYYIYKWLTFDKQV